jgi:D-alanine-D-alanine ligase
VTRPRVWISVDFERGRRFRSCFDSAFELRGALRAAGYTANLFSLTRPLDFLRSGGEDVVFPVAETVAVRRADPFWLRRALEQRGVAVVGSSYAVVTAASDKARARAVLSHAGYSVPAGIVVRGRSLADAAAAFVGTRGFPVVAKPSVGGGSMGVEYLRDAGALRRWVRRFETGAEMPLLLEEYVSGMELTTWVVDCGRAVVATMEIVKHDAPIFDRTAKAGPQDDIPVRARVAAHVPSLQRDVLQRVEDTAVGVHRLFGVRAYSRTDMIVRDGWPVVLELNTTPRLRPGSTLSPFQGPDFNRFVIDLVNEASNRVTADQRRSAAAVGR